MPRVQKNNKEPRFVVQEQDEMEMDIDFGDEPAAHGTRNHEDDDDQEDLLNLQVPPMPESMALREGGERLVITHIEVDNFKSYYGKQVIGPFHKCFTSIIGPNGSGKSNVIDALLFVFGYRASKIRSKKVSVLIHSSAGRDQLHTCTVTVHFCKIVDSENETSGYKKVLGSDIAVSRSANRDNSSKYTLNGRMVKFKEVAEVLRTNGIDLVHNRFLILQGEVEQISMMKPKAEKEEEEGMLEYLEDIIGSSRLKPFIVKLQTRIERLNERRVLQLQRVQHAEKERQQLDGPVREVLAQMRLENAITGLTNKIYACKKLSFADKLKEARAAKSAMDAELWTASEKLNGILNQAKQVSKERQQLQNKLDKCHEALQSVERQKSTQEQLITRAESDTKRLEAKRDKLAKELEAEKQKFAELESDPERCARRIEDFRRQLEEAEAEIEECAPILMAKLEEVQQQVHAERREKGELETRLGKLSAEEDQLNSNLTLAQERVLNLRREEETQRRKFEQLQADLLDTEEALGRNERSLHQQEEDTPELEATLEGKTARLEHLQGREQRLTEAIRELRRQLAEQKQTEEHFHSNNRLVNRLMEAKRSGEIEGILGRLGDLGAIEQKYDLTVSTNFPALEYFVVADVECAQRCIELLKREQLGLSTFVALNKQQGFWANIRNVPKTPEDTPRLIDLIRVNDEQVLPAFYYILGDTLVADNIEAATRMGTGAYGRRWKTVTLKGELVDISGAMTGGGVQQTKSRIGREVLVDTSRDHAAADDTARRLQMVTELEGQLKNAEAEVSGIQRECMALEPELAKRREDLRHRKDALHALGLEIENNRSKIAALSKQVEAQKRNVLKSVANPEDVRKAQEEVEQFRKKSDKLAQDTDSLRLQVMALDERIAEVEERLAGPFQKRKTEAEEQKRGAESGINREKATIAAAERNKNKSRVRMENLEQDIQDKALQFAAAEQRGTQAREQLAELDDLGTQRQAELEDARQALTLFVQSLSERDDEEVELQRLVEQLQREQKQLAGDVSGLEGKLKACETKISKLRFYRLQKLMETLPKELEQSNHDYGQEEENDENADIDEDEEEDDDDGIPVQRRRAQPIQAIGADGLDRFLEDCYRAEEAHGQMEREYGQLHMEIDENEEQQEGEEDAPNTSHGSNRSGSSRRRQNAPNVVVPSTLSQQQCFVPVPELDELTIRGLDEEELEVDLQQLEAKREKQRVNLALVAEYLQKSERYSTHLAVLSSITALRDLHRAEHDRLKKQRLHEFMGGFQQIATLLRTTYQMITIQGDVSLELVDSLDPFSEGIAFNVRPPKKSWKQITNLSGGEKTLASLSLVFGLHHYKPTPLYVMDEIDAALDFRNVSIIANYLLERTRNAQFVVISLRNQMYEKADRLIGIFKVNDCTRNVCVDPQQASRNGEEAAQGEEARPNNNVNMRAIVGQQLQNGIGTLD